MLKEPDGRSGPGAALLTALGYIPAGLIVMITLAMVPESRFFVTLLQCAGLLTVPLAVSFVIERLSKSPFGFKWALVISTCVAFILLPLLAGLIAHFRTDIPRKHGEVKIQLRTQRQRS